MIKLYMPCEVADILRRPVRSIYELVKLRQLGCIRSGRRILFRQEDINAFIEANTIPAHDHFLSCPKVRHGANKPNRVSPDSESGGVL